MNHLRRAILFLLLSSVLFSTSISTTSAREGIFYIPDYDSLLKLCCQYSNVTLGTSYANLRNDTSQFKFSFEDFTLLAKVISLESGSDFVPV